MAIVNLKCKRYKFVAIVNLKCKGYKFVAIVNLKCKGYKFGAIMYGEYVLVIFYIPAISVKI